MRSDTDDWLISMMEDPERLIAFAEDASLRQARKTLEDAKQLQELRPKGVGLGVDRARVALLQFVK
jgi:hypothetical protein